MTSTTIASESTRSGVLYYLGLGLRGAALASVVNVAIYVLSKTVFNLPFAVPMQSGAAPTPLPIFMIILVSAVPAVLAAGVLYILNRFSHHGLRIFQGIAAVLALLSIVGPLMLPIDSGTIAALASMHLAAAASIVGVFTVLSSRAHSGR